MNRRPIKDIYLHPGFKKRYKRLPEHKKKLAKKKEQIFRQNPFNPRLRIHKLHGQLKGLWAFDIDDSLRITFEFIDDQTVGFVDIGPHAIYK